MLAEIMMFVNVYKEDTNTHPYFIKTLETDFHLLLQEVVLCFLGGVSPGCEGWELLYGKPFFSLNSISVCTL